MNAIDLVQLVFGQDKGVIGKGTSSLAPSSPRGFTHGFYFWIFDIGFQLLIFGASGEVVKCSLLDCFTDRDDFCV